MKDYTIAETYTLPSLGKIYDRPFDPVIKIRSMTTQEEMKRLSPSELPYRNMCEVVDDCLVDGPEMSSYDMCIGDYQFLLHKLRIVTYGADYQSEFICPYCGARNQEVINLEELPILEYDEKMQNLREFDLPVSKKHIKLKVQTPRMLDEVTQRVKEHKKKSKSEMDPTLMYTVEYLIDEIDGVKPNPLDLTEWVRQLPMKDTNIIITYADKLNTSIGIDVKRKLECNVCGLKADSTFKPTAEFFRPALDIRW